MRRRLVLPPCPPRARRRPARRTPPGRAYPRRTPPASGPPVLNASASPAPLPDRARVVIVGGGIVGASIAWHLARRGCGDVLLLERRQLGCGTTWHSQALVGLVRPTDAMTRLALHTNEVLPELERLTGLSTGFERRGAVIVTADPGRVGALEALSRDKARLGLEIRRIDTGEAAERWPPLEVDDLAGAWFMPEEGQTGALDTLLAYARAARLEGATIREGVEVRDVLVDGARAVGVRTADGHEIACEAVVDASGIWSRRFAGRAGVALPMLPVRQTYFVTEPLPGLEGSLPILRDFGEGLLAREDAGQLTIVALSPREPLFGVDGIPEDFAFEELPTEDGAIEAVIEGVVHRVPALAEAGLRKGLTGPECVSFDARYCLGEAPALAGYFVASGMSGVGVGSSGGIGREMAAWILDGAPTMDLGDVDVRRAAPFQTELDWLVERVPGAAGGFYDVREGAAADAGA